jgi:hypothetical protein
MLQCTQNLGQAHLHDLLNTCSTSSSTETKPPNTLYPMFTHFSRHAAFTITHFTSDISDKSSAKYAHRSRHHGPAAKLACSFKELARTQFSHVSPNARHEAHAFKASIHHPTYPFSRELCNSEVKNHPQTQCCKLKNCIALSCWAVHCFTQRKWYPSNPFLTPCSLKEYYFTSMPLKLIMMAKIVLLQLGACCLEQPPTATADNQCCCSAPEPASPATKLEWWR